MSSKTFIREINTGKNKYSIFLVEPDKMESYKIPYVLACPEKYEKDSKIIMETNNLEFKDGKYLDWNIKEDKQFMINDAIESVIGNDGKFGLIEYADSVNSSFLMPIIPSVSGGKPYFQQLSVECFSDKIPNSSEFYRIDNQICEIINDAINFLDYDNKIIEGKVFFNGYSSSGVFAQRFAFLHPEFVNQVLIGGAISSIPMPENCLGSNELEYPLGTSNYTSKIGLSFNNELYKNIKFRYYVDGMEDIDKCNKLIDGKNVSVPIQDMVYNDRSVQPTDGIMERYLYGKNIFERAAKQIKIMINQGYDVETKVNFKKIHQNGRISPSEFKKVFERGSFDKKRIALRDFNKIRKVFQFFGKIKYNNDLKNVEKNLMLKSGDEEYDRIIDCINIDKDKKSLVNLFFSEVKNNNINQIIDNYKKNQMDDIYYTPLQTEISQIQSLNLVKDFFINYFPEKKGYIEQLINKKYVETDKYVQLSIYSQNENLCFFNTKYDCNQKGYNKYSKSPSAVMPKEHEGIHDMMIYVPLYNDLRDVYGLVHEISHSFDISNGETTTRKILGEVVPQAMERLLDSYLLNFSDENIKKYKFNKEILKQDIKTREQTTFISRYNMIEKLNDKKENKEKLTKYMLAQLYQEKIKNYINKGNIKKIKSFITEIENNDFDQANKSIGVRIKENDFLNNRNELVNDTIKSFKNLFDDNKNKEEKVAEKKVEKEQSVERE